MALDSFFHNKIESMKLEIIQGQAVLRRLEAQRNDYNSRGSVVVPSQLLVLTPSSTAAKGRTGITATTWILCWGGCEGDGNEEGPGQGPPGRQIWYAYMDFICRPRADDRLVVDVSDNVDISKLTVGKRVTLLSDSYKLEKCCHRPSILWYPS